MPFLFSFSPMRVISQALWGHAGLEVATPIARGAHVVWSSRCSPGEGQMSWVEAALHSLSRLQREKLQAMAGDAITHLGTEMFM